jgi:hypothetical protein
MTQFDSIHHVDTGYIKLFSTPYQDAKKGVTPTLTVCKIEYLHDFYGSFQCVMTPFWSVIQNPPEPYASLWGVPLEIAGIDEKRFREVYRFPLNVDPPFVYRHAPPRGSQRSLDKCASVGLRSFEPIEYMIRETLIYDCYIVERDP